MSGGLEDLLIDAKTQKSKQSSDDLRTLYQKTIGTQNETFYDLPEFNRGENYRFDSLGNLEDNGGYKHPADFEPHNDLKPHNDFEPQDYCESQLDVETPDDSEEFLSDILQNLRNRIIIVGVGGAGNNAISRLQDVGVSNALTISINTDAQDLFYSNSDKKLLIGKKITCGLGAGNDHIAGEKAAESDIDRIRPLVNGNVVFIACGLGGGTGTGSAPIIAKTAKEQGALVITFCTLPFVMEGEEKRIIALKGLKKLAQYSDTIIPLPNEKLINLIPNITLIKGFKVMDEILIRSIKALVDLISTCGLVNLDLADVKNVLKKRENASGFIGISEISLQKLEEYNSKNLEVKALDNKNYDMNSNKNNTMNSNKDSNIDEDNLDKNHKMNQINNTSINILKERTIKALKNPILEFDPKKINSCLVSISGNQNLTLTQIDCIVRTVSENISKNAKIKFGTIIEPNSKTIKINIIGQGDISPYLLEAYNL